MPKLLTDDTRTVLTLDAGGTSFRFSAMRGQKLIAEPWVSPSYGDDLHKCLRTLEEGFRKIQDQLAEPASAISFAFPGPADYRRGIIGDLGNLSGFRGGVALGPYLQSKFKIPVFINNDGDLFVYGEAIAGFLPYVNGLLEKSGSSKRFHNLFGMTFGTGLGGGIVQNGNIFFGDNVSAAEIWTFRNKLSPKINAEEGVSIRAVKRVYAECAGLRLEECPEPKDIFEIFLAKKPGNQAAAAEAFRRLGEVAGDVLAHALSLVDGLAVIGGGISHAAPAFLPALIDELNSNYDKPGGEGFRRLPQKAYNLEDPLQRERFLKGNEKFIFVPGSQDRVVYDDQPRLGVGISRLGTSEAIAVGAYAYALQQLDRS